MSDWREALRLIEIPHDVEYVAAKIYPDPWHWVVEFFDWQQYNTGEWDWGVYDDCLVPRQFVAYQVASLLHETEYEHLHAYRSVGGWSCFASYVPDDLVAIEYTGSTFVEAVMAAANAEYESVPP